MSPKKDTAFMSRSICYAEPKFALAGQVRTWKFIYQSGQTLPKGTNLKFDLFSRGREMDWELPECGARKKNKCIWFESETLGKLIPEQLTQDGEALPQYEVTLPSDLPEGEELYILIGTQGDDPSQGIRAQTNVQRRRSFFLSIDTKGKKEYKETEHFALDVRGNVLSDMRILVPSLLAKNQRFDIMVRFEDAYGNLTGNAPEGTLVELSYEQLRENINWKLFVPETGFITLPNLYFNEEGIYRIQLKNLSTNDIYFSSPILCKPFTSNQMFWGSFRSEFEIYDCSENAESAIRYARDDDALQFMSTSPFESDEETPVEIWKHVAAQVAEFNEDERFTTFSGFQYQAEEGLRTLVYSKDNKALLRKNDTKSNSLKKIYRSHTPKDFISIPSFTMAKGVHTDFSDFTPEYEKVVEIYNAWGSSECTAKEGNTRPIVSKSKKGFNETSEGSVRSALNRGFRFGFVAGGHDDRGIFAHLYETDQEQYTPGVTAIVSEGLTRDQLFAAMTRRSTFATTGPRMLVDIQIAKQPMGISLSTKEKPGLSYNRHIEITAVGTEPLTKVELIRNGEVAKTFKPDSSMETITYDDMEKLEGISLRSEEDNTPFTYYYVRLTQEDGHMAWSSPIWIDLYEAEPVSKKAKTK